MRHYDSTTSRPSVPRATKTSQKIAIRSLIGQDCLVQRSVRGASCAVAELSVTAEGPNCVRTGLICTITVNGSRIAGADQRMCSKMPTAPRACDSRHTDYDSDSASSWRVSTSANVMFGTKAFSVSESRCQAGTRMRTSRLTSPDGRRLRRTRSPAASGRG